LQHLFQNKPEQLILLPELTRPIHPMKDFLAHRKLCRHFRQTRPDIVHTHSGKAGILGRLAARKAGVPLVIHTIHGPSFGPFQGFTANTVFRQAERIAARSTHHFISVADAMTSQYLAAGIGQPEQYTRILSGFDLKPFLEARNSPELRRKFGFSESDIVIGKVARLAPLKGHEDLFRVAPKLITENPSVRFLLVGDGPLRDTIEARARELRIADKVAFTGLVPPGDVPSLLGIMDIVVHLSRREGLPRALSQALTASVPVVAFDCDGAREVCIDGQTGFLVQPDDLETLTRRLDQLARDAELRHRLGRQGQQMAVELFSVETMVDEIEKLYRRLAADMKLRI
jgi:glycosyltransferase involved in cell wall biosynthesis